MSMQKLGVNGPYDAGHKAFQMGQGLRDCPYESENDSQNWKDGWWDASKEAATAAHSDEVK